MFKKTFRVLSAQDAQKASHLRLSDKKIIDSRKFNGDQEVVDYLEMGLQSFKPFEEVQEELNNSSIEEHNGKAFIPFNALSMKSLDSYYIVTAKEDGTLKYSSASYLDKNLSSEEMVDVVEDFMRSNFGSDQGLQEEERSDLKDRFISMMINSNSRLSVIPLNNKRKFVKKEVATA